MDSKTVIEMLYEDLERWGSGKVREAEVAKLRAELNQIIFDTNDVKKHFHIDPQTIKKYADDGLIECEERKTKEAHYRFRLGDLIFSDFKKLKRKLKL